MCKLVCFLVSNCDTKSETFTIKEVLVIRVLMASDGMGETGEALGIWLISAVNL